MIQIVELHKWGVVRAVIMHDNWCSRRCLWLKLLVYDFVCIENVDNSFIYSSVLFQAARPAHSRHENLLKLKHTKHIAKHTQEDKQYMKDRQRNCENNIADGRETKIGISLILSNKLIFSSAGWAIHISWSKRCLFECVWMLTRVA